MLSRINLTHIDDFKIYLTNNNVEHRDGKGEYQALQVNTELGWVVIHKKKDILYGTTHNALVSQLIKAFYADQATKPQAEYYKYLARYSDRTIDTTPYAQTREEARQLAVIGGYCDALCDVAIITRLDNTRILLTPAQLEIKPS